MLRSAFHDAGLGNRCISRRGKKRKGRNKFVVRKEYGTLTSGQRVLAVWDQCARRLDKHCDDPLLVAAAECPFDSSANARIKIRVSALLEALVDKAGSHLVPSAGRGYRLA